MTLTREMCELSSRARAFSVEALIGVKSQSNEETDVRQKQNLTAKNRPNSKVHQSAATSTGGTTKDDSRAEKNRDTASEGDTLQMQQRLRLKQTLRVELCSRELWRKFHALGTEMIITKAGRRMFPTVKVRLSGLDPTATYIVFLDMVPVDDKRYRYVYHSSQWMVAGSGDPPLGHNLYVHPDSPATGQLWMAQGVVAFDKLKLTNNRKPMVRGQVSLHSMHKYLPRVHILLTTDLQTPPEQQASVDRAVTYSFAETTFTTVTAYQNQQITRLKIASNPFAKGFREASRSRDSTDDTCYEIPLEFRSSPFVGPSKFYPADFFAMQPDYTFSPSSSPTSLFQPRRFFDPYGISSKNTTSTLFQASPDPYPYHSDPPLKLPVKFVVPPSNYNVCNDPKRKLWFEDISACDKTNKFTNNGHMKNVGIENYSKLISEENVSGRHNCEYFQNMFLSNPPRNIINGNHQPAATLDECENTISDKQLRKRSSENDDNIFHMDDKCKELSNCDNNDRRSNSKYIITRRRFADERVTTTRRNIQKFLADPATSVVPHQYRYDRRESKPTTASCSGSNAPKIKIASPLDLTKLK